MATIMEIEQKRLLKKFHALLGAAGIDQEGKLSLLAQYGVESSKDLTAYELLEICNKLALQSDPQMAALDKNRKRLIASIYSWREAMGCKSNINEVKGIACRAAGVAEFNHINNEKLRSLYSAFTKKTKDLDKVHNMTVEMMAKLSNQN